MCRIRTRSPRSLGSRCDVAGPCLRGTARAPGRALFLAFARSLVVLLGLALNGCDRPVVPAERTQAIAAYSASPFAIDVKFEQPLNRTEALTVSHYSITGPTLARVVPTRIAWVDTLFGETVRLFFPLGTLEDSALYRLTVAGLRDAWGQPLFAVDSAAVEVYTGLWYSNPIRSLLARKCTPCHSDRRAGGDYRTDSYEALYALGTDAASSSPRPNLIPGDARSLLVIRTSPLHSMFNIAHLNYEESQLITNWVVTYQARK